MSSVQPLTAGDRTSRWRCWHVAVLTIGLLLPFVQKPFNVDDPLFVWAADRIRVEPLRPYLFSVNWYGTDQPIWRVAQNPPLQSYYLAAVRASFGTSEAVLHLAMLVPVLVCVVSVWDLARSLWANQLAAVVWTVATPTFAVSASTVMCDVPMLALWCGACACWLRGIARPHHGWLLLAALLAGLAGWMKYFGMACVPLLFCHGWARRRSLGLWTVSLLVPVAMYLAWDLWSSQVFGQSHIVQATRYAQIFRVSLSPAQQHPLANVIPALSFAGGGLLVPLLAWRLVSSWRYAAGVAVATSLLALAFAPSVRAAWKVEPGGLEWAELGLFALGGAFSLTLCCVHVAQRRDADALLLAAWSFGTFCFAAFFNWTVSGRTILPMAPAVALAMAREIDPRQWTRWRQSAALAATAVAVGVCFILLRADARWAAANRVAARDISEKYDAAGGRLWFLGHWGLQYYLERAGAKSVRFNRSVIEPGDWLLVPKNSPGVERPHPNSVVVVERLEYELPQLAAVMNYELGAGFYSSVWGPLPWSFGPVSPESFEILSPKPQ
jgi:4-amino-4-deoxy-L-arabinose transferase-like glycosyltransferase